MTETEYIEKESVMELLKKLGCRVIIVPDESICSGSIVIIHDEKTETIIKYINGGCLQ